MLDMRTVNMTDVTGFMYDKYRGDQLSGDISAVRCEGARDAGNIATHDPGRITPPASALYCFIYGTKKL